MALIPGTRLGVDEITSLLGEGGMGQVYRWTDTKLKRQVEWIAFGGRGCPTGQLDRRAVAVRRWFV